MSDIRIPFHRELKRLVEEQIDTEMGAISSGIVGSFDEYRYRVGRLKAYADVLAIAEQIEQRFSGDR